MTDRIRVCHIIHDTSCGGTESMLLKLAGHLRSDVSASVVSLMGIGSIGRKIQALGVPVIPLGLPKSGRQLMVRFPKVVRAIRSQQPQVVQTWGYHADLIGGIAAKFATRAPILWNIRHATLDPKLDSVNVLRSARLCARLSRFVPDKILLNAHSAAEVHGQFGYRRSIMRVVPNGFDINVFRPSPEQGRAVREELGIPNGALTIGMCGRFHPHKGQQQFIEVAGQLKRSYPQAHFVVAGSDCHQDNAHLMRWIQAQELQTQVHLCGERSDIPAVLNALDVFVLPSVTEGMPNVVGEAMACGIPVVATDVGDARHLIDEHGIVVPANDLPSMCQAIESMLLRSAGDRAELGKRSREHIERHYSLDAIAKEYATLWKNAAGVSDVGIARPRNPAPQLVHVTTIPMSQWLFLRGQFGYMKAQGFDVHSVSSPGEYLEKIQQRDPVTTHPIFVSRKIAPWRDAVSLRKLIKLFGNLNPEIVQVSTPKAALLGALAAWWCRVPIRIYQVRGLSSESERGVKRWVYQRLEALTARLCNAHLVNARSLLAYARDAKILSGGYVAGQGMSNGVDLQRFEPSSVAAVDLRKWDPTWNENAGPVIGFLGRLTRDKGLEDLHRVWTRVRSDYPDARLLLVGPEEAENSMHADCRESLHRDPRVLVTGTQEDVAPFYAAMDVFVYPTHGTEGFPNAPMEAAAMALPVIATRVVGCTDAVVHETTGLLIEPQSPEQLERALRAYLEDPMLRRRHGLAGQQRIQTGFAPEALWESFYHFYLHQLRLHQQPLPTAEPVPTEERRAA